MPSSGPSVGGERHTGTQPAEEHAGDEAGDDVRDAGVVAHL
jgi:hypothetical protein